MNLGVTIYTADVSRAKPATDWKSLSADEIQRIERQNDEVQKDSIGRRFFLRREILCKHLDLKLSDLVIEIQSGIPKLISQPTVFFSTSYSGNYMTLAIAAFPVGVDMEEWLENKSNAHAALLFHPQEQWVLEKAPDYNALFYTIWTQKEAYLKASGRAKELEFKKFVVSPEGGIVRVLDGKDREQDWFTQLVDWKSNFALALASAEPVSQPEMIEWDASS